VCPATVPGTPSVLKDGTFLFRKPHVNITGTGMAIKADEENLQSEGLRNLQRWQRNSDIRCFVIMGLKFIAPRCTPMANEIILGRVPSMLGLGQPPTMFSMVYGGVCSWDWSNEDMSFHPYKLFVCNVCFY
jgi:hypothetical protein